jgi:hypothetical protein
VLDRTHERDEAQGAGNRDYGKNQIVKYSHYSIGEMGGDEGERDEG